MHQAPLRAPAKRVARPKPAHRPAQRNAAPDAALNQLASCALDLPALHKDIPRTVTLSLASSSLAQMADTTLSLAIEATERGVAKLNQAEPFAANVQLAASQALRDAMRRAGHTFECRWWPTVNAAESGRSPRENAQTGQEIDGPHPPQNCIVIEFEGMQPLKKLRAAHNLTSSEVLAECESICPGLTHMLYTVMEGVYEAIWPITTPRTLWNDYIYGSSAEGSQMCDAGIAIYQLSEYCDPADLHKKYGIEAGSFDNAHAAVAIHQEEIGSVLPSYFIASFGRAAIGTWPIFSSDPDAHETIPNPWHRIHEDISVAMANMAARRPWCPWAPCVSRALERMAQIVRNIRAGAHLACGTYVSANPTTSDIRLWRFAGSSKTTVHEDSESNAFNRLLDDAARCAWESGEAVECVGWFRAPASTAEQAKAALATLELGVSTLDLTLDLILQLFRRKKDHVTDT